MMNGAGKHAREVVLRPRYGREQGLVNGTWNVGLRRTVSERGAYQNSERRRLSLGNRPPADCIKDEEILQRRMPALPRPGSQSGTKDRPWIPS